MSLSWKYCGPSKNETGLLALHSGPVWCVKMWNGMAKRTQSLLRQLLPVAELHLHNTNTADIISSLRISKSLISANFSIPLGQFGLNILQPCLTEDIKLILPGALTFFKSKCFGAENRKHIPACLYYNTVW